MSETKNCWSALASTLIKNQPNTTRKSDLEWFHFNWAPYWNRFRHHMPEQWFPSGSKARSLDAPVYWSDPRGIKSWYKNDELAFIRFHWSSLTWKRRENCISMIINEYTCENIWMNAQIFHKALGFKNAAVKFNNLSTLYFTVLKYRTIMQASYLKTFFPTFNYKQCFVWSSPFVFTEQ